MIETSCAAIENTDPQAYFVYFACSIYSDSNSLLAYQLYLTDNLQFEPFAYSYAQLLEGTT